MKYTHHCFVSWKGEQSNSPCRVLVSLPTLQDTPPIVQRAQNIKAELKDSEHIKYKLESKDQDLRDLRLLMKQKNEELSEMVVRRDLAEKKLVTATKDADATIEKLQRKVDDTVMLLRRKEKVGGATTSWVGTMCSKWIMRNASCRPFCI